MNNRLQHVGALLFALSLACNEETVRFETLEDDCRRTCHVVMFVCDNAGKDPQADEDRCTEACLGETEQVWKNTAECAQRYEDMMICAGSMVKTCEDWYAWVRREDAGPCAAESLMFDQGCKAK